MNTAMRSKLPLWTAGLLVSLLAGTVRSAEKAAASPEQAPLDKQISSVLRDIHNRGADLYNGDDAAGCYRMFQGALMALRPALGSHPDVQQIIDTGLANAERQTAMARRAFVLHEVIEATRSKLRGVKPVGDKPKVAATLWERLGGEANVRKVVDDYVAMVATDPKVDFSRGGKYKLTDADIVRVKQDLVDFIGQVTGGPLKYTGRNMQELHKGMGITNVQFDASAADLKLALEKNHAQAADIDAFLLIVESTRKDIVEPEQSKPKETKPEETKPEEKNPAEKKPGDFKD